MTAPVTAEIPAWRDDNCEGDEEEASRTWLRAQPRASELLVDPARLSAQASQGSGTVDTAGMAHAQTPATALARARWDGLATDAGHAIRGAGTVMTPAASVQSKRRSDIDSAGSAASGTAETHRDLCQSRPSPHGCRCRGLELRRRMQ